MGFVYKALDFVPLLPQFKMVANLRERVVLGFPLKISLLARNITCCSPKYFTVFFYKIRTENLKPVPYAFLSRL